MGEWLTGRFQEFRGCSQNFKMKKYLVSCATEEFYKKQKMLNESALKFGIDKTFPYIDKDIEKTGFYKNNKMILDQKKAPGYGYSIWKPHIILDVMKKIKRGDILFYVDSGAEIISNVQPLVDLCKKNKGILLFNAVNINKYWTKRDCFVAMKCDSKKYWNASQVMGGYQVYIKNARSVKFLKEDLKYVQISHLIDDTPSTLPNFNGFKRHRHDQSVLTNLAVKYGVKTFRNPSQGGNYLKIPEIREKNEWRNCPYSKSPDIKSKYPTIFYNKRDAGPIRLFLIKLKFFLTQWQI